MGLPLRDSRFSEDFAFLPVGPDTRWLLGRCSAVRRLLGYVFPGQGWCVLVRSICVDVTRPICWDCLRFAGGRQPLTIWSIRAWLHSSPSCFGSSFFIRGSYPDFSMHILASDGHKNGTRFHHETKKQLTPAGVSIRNSTGGDSRASLCSPNLTILRERRCGSIR